MGDVIVKDRKLKQLFGVLRRARNVEVRVGIFGDAAAAPHPKAKMTVGDLAHIHEFGAPAARIPQRSFVRSTINENRPGIKLVQILYAEALVKRRSIAAAKKILEDAANKLADAMRAKMDRGIAGVPEGPVRDLQDTGVLRDSIEVEIK